MAAIDESYTPPTGVPAEVAPRRDVGGAGAPTKEAWRKSSSRLSPPKMCRGPSLLIGKKSELMVKVFTALPSSKPGDNLIGELQLPNHLSKQEVKKG